MLASDWLRDKQLNLIEEGAVCKYLVGDHIALSLLVNKQKIQPRVLCPRKI